MIDSKNHKLREDMMYLLGQIDAIQYPLMWMPTKQNINQGYYDLLESIRHQYLKILNQAIGYEE